MTEAQPEGAWDTHTHTLHSVMITVAVRGLPTDNQLSTMLAGPISYFRVMSTVGTATWPLVLLRLRSEPPRRPPFMTGL